MNRRTGSKASLFLGIASGVALSAVAIFDLTGIFSLACLGLAVLILLISMLLR